jgi:predicted RNA binding protein YcfA (HicA-like mRNA interferase family)
MPTRTNHGFDIGDRSFLIYHLRMNGKDIVAKLKAAGWTLNRVRGSHHVTVKDGRAVPVPVHGSQDVGAGLVVAIARQSGVDLKK